MKEPPQRVRRHIEVRPGGRATIDLPIAYLFTHVPMTMPVHVVHGRKPGLSLFVSVVVLLVAGWVLGDPRNKPGINGAAIWRHA